MNKDLNHKLEYIFDNVNRWLKFAEAKHVAVVIFNSGVIVGILNSLDKLEKVGLLTGMFGMYFYILLVCLVVSILISVLSFMPKTKIDWLFTRKNELRDNDNIYFYGHIKNYDEKTYLELVLKKFNIEQSGDDLKVFIPLANQIIQNSRIASKKFNYFRKSSWLIIHGFFTPLGGLILWLLQEE